MRKDFGSKDWVQPMPVLVLGTYDEEGKPNAMTAAWGNMCHMEPLTIQLNITATQKTAKNLYAGSDITVHITNKATMEAADFVGIASGNDMDKVAKTGWTVKKSEFVKAPVFEEFPIALECKLLSISERATVLAEIVNVSVDEKYLDGAGQPDISKMDIISFNSIKQTYNVIGEEVGDAYIIGQSLLK